MVTFYELRDGKPVHPVLYLDTLKVSTIEQTAESVDARGGKGNAALISWDYGKEINVTLEDALFSAKSMAIMFGNGNVTTLTAGSDNGLNIMRTEIFSTTCTSTISVTASTNSALISEAKEAGWNPNYIGPDGIPYEKKNPKFYTANGNVIASNTTISVAGDTTITGVSEFNPNTKYFCTFDLVMKPTASVIEISANSFPGTYYVTGDTYARSEADGRDEFFQFIIPKAKVTAENTITLEAEGDPSVFNMSLKVLRPEDGVMMKLVKYDLDEGGLPTNTGSNWIHNHTLDVQLA